MGAFNFIWDLHQSGQLEELREEVDQLKQRVVVLEEWIRHLTESKEEKVDFSDGRE